MVISNGITRLNIIVVNGSMNNTSPYHLANDFLLFGTTQRISLPEHFSSRELEYPRVPRSLYRFPVVAGGKHLQGNNLPVFSVSILSSRFSRLFCIYSLSIFLSERGVEKHHQGKP